MATPAVVETPASPREVADLLRRAGDDGACVRPRGGATKLGWGSPSDDPGVVVSTAKLDRMVEHNAGDLTAVLEAGVRLADAQAAFREAGQMLALDPPLGEEDAATVGGVVATADAGSLRHRYGAPRDMLLGLTAALPDGTVARSGGRVIKNVAGYDLAKLFTGSFGTLGVIVEVVVRLHPLAPATATAVGAGDDGGALARAAHALAQAPLELESLDVAWNDGHGAILARAGGTQATRRAGRVAETLDSHGLDAEVREDDDPLWAAQRAGQRSGAGTVVRVSGLPAELERVLAATAEAGGSLVGRAAVGISWIALPPDAPDAVAEAVSALRRELAPFPCVVLDAPAAVRARVDVWGVEDVGLLALSRRVKERFDPRGTCNPGVYVGGI
jgi:glycolate oxidase FAD binding subunit